MIDKAIKATTQEHLDIYTIKEHFVILKDGSTALVLQISAINFGLLSEEEQDALIFSYASLLNSLSFPIQIIVRSVKKDITSYLELLDDRLEQTSSQKLKEQIVKYRSFIRSLVKKNKVLEKKFYVVIPYSYLGVNQVSNNLNPLAKPPQKPPQDVDFLVAKSKQELYPRRDHLIRQFARLGLQCRQLTTQELVTLFYKTYNPSTQGIEQYLTLPTDYETPAVQTKVRNLYTEKDTPTAPIAPTPTTPIPTPATPTQPTTPPPSNPPIIPHQTTTTPQDQPHSPTPQPTTPPNPSPITPPTQPTFSSPSPSPLPSPSPTPPPASPTQNQTLSMPLHHLHPLTQTPNLSTSRPSRLSYPSLPSGHLTASTFSFLVTHFLP